MFKILSLQTLQPDPMVQKSETLLFHRNSKICQRVRYLKKTISEKDFVDVRSRMEQKSRGKRKNRGKVEKLKENNKSKAVCDDVNNFGSSVADKSMV